MGFCLGAFLILGLIQETFADNATPLHCCFAPTNRPVVLACDQQEGDYILQVPFAYFGSVPFEQRICGSDRPGAYSNSTATGVHIQHHLSSSCVQKQILVLPVTTRYNHLTTSNHVDFTKTMKSMNTLDDSQWS